MYIYPQGNLNLSTISVKKGTHSDSWPYPLEIKLGKDTIHLSLHTEKDQTTLVECIQHQGKGKVGQPLSLHCY